MGNRWRVIPLLLIVTCTPYVACPDQPPNVRLIDLIQNSASYIGKRVVTHGRIVDAHVHGLCIRPCGKGAKVGVMPLGSGVREMVAQAISAPNLLPGEMLESLVEGTAV